MRQRMNGSELEMFDRVGVGLARVDTHGAIRYANRRLGEWLGREPNGLVGQSLTDLVEESDGPAVEAALGRAADSWSGGHATCFLATDAGWPVDVEMAPLESPSGLREILVTLRPTHAPPESGEPSPTAASPSHAVKPGTDGDDSRDATDEPAAPSSRQVLDGLVEGVFAIDRKRRLTYINPAARRMLGLSSDFDVLGMDSHALLHHSDPSGHPLPPEACPILGVLKTGDSLQDWSDCFWRDDRTCFPVRVHAASLKGAAGGIDGAVISFRDESAVVEGEQSLAKAVRHLPGAIYQYRRMPDGREGFPFVSGGVQGLFGVSADQALRHPARVLAMVHADDLPRLRATIEESAQSLRKVCTNPIPLCAP